MREIWLRQNRRGLAFGLIPPVLIGLIGLWLTGLLTPMSAGWVRGLGWIMLVGGGGMSAVLVAEMFRPRLAYADGRLLIHVRAGPPYRVPIEIVECFLMGQGPASLPGKKNDRSETVTLVIRLAERAEDWAHRETKRALAAWCGGQITLRGTWCEPLSVPLVNRLNARLDEVQRARRKQVAT